MRPAKHALKQKVPLFSFLFICLVTSFDSSSRGVYMSLCKIVFRGYSNYFVSLDRAPDAVTL